jgi:hypothetical protein
VIGSKIIQVIEQHASQPDFSTVLTKFAKEICGKTDVTVKTYAKSSGMAVESDF